MERTINLIGIGTDGDRSLTQEAKQLIGESTVLIGAKRMLKSTKKYQKENVLCYEKYRPEEVLHILETVPDGEDFSSILRRSGMLQWSRKDDRRALSGRLEGEDLSWHCFRDCYGGTLSGSMGEGRFCKPSRDRPECDSCDLHT